MFKYVHFPCERILTGPSTLLERPLRIRPHKTLSFVRVATSRKTVSFLKTRFAVRMLETFPNKISELKKNYKNLQLSYTTDDDDDDACSGIPF